MGPGYNNIKETPNVEWQNWKKKISVKKNSKKDQC